MQRAGGTGRSRWRRAALALAALLAFGTAPALADGGRHWWRDADGHWRNNGDDWRRGRDHDRHWRRDGHHRDRHDDWRWRDRDRRRAGPPVIVVPNQPGFHYVDPRARDDFARRPVHRHRPPAYRASPRFRYYGPPAYSVQPGVNLVPPLR